MHPSHTDSYYGASNLTSIDLKTEFKIPDSFTLDSKPQPQVLPRVSNGTLWSNEIDTFWLYGGEVFDDMGSSNSIWRFKADTGEGSWNEIDPRAANLSQHRPTHGAGCNALSRAAAYYLGGYTRLNGSNDSLHYLHSMTMFDMKREMASTYDIPDYIPIIDPNLVYLDAGTEGILVVIGGQTESNGVLDMVNSMDFMNHQELTYAQTPMDKIYIYDIASGARTVQATTDQKGHTNHSYGGYDTYGVGIPNRRYGMCSVLGIAPDRSSYNIYVFGGFNGTHMPGDIWALSLPRYLSAQKNNFIFI